MESYAKQLAFQRNPIARVLTLSTPGTPMDRLVYARLSPKHMDNNMDRLTSNLMALSAPIVANLHLKQYLTNEDIMKMKQYAPFTDQMYFQLYLQSYVPSLKSNNMY
jgi:hypothetical protein